MIEFIDGFDHYNNATNVARKWDVGSNLNNFSAGRFGGNAISATGGGANTVTLTAQQTRVMGFALQTNSTTLNGIIAQFKDAGSNQVELRLDGSQHLQVTRNATVLGTSSSTYPISAWHYVEWKVKIDPSTGTYEVRVDGVNVLSGTGANTRNTANSTANQALINSLGGFTLTFDDLYILNTSGSANNDFLGECRIFTSLPTGDDASFKQWTPSTGTSHFANVDDNPPNDDTDFNSSATVGQIDLFTFPSISPTGSIACVQTVLTARKDDAGTRQICEECRSGSTNYDGANTFTMNSTYGMFREIRETDPATSAAWTLSGLNAAEFGAKVLV